MESPRKVLEFWGSGNPVSVITQLGVVSLSVRYYGRISNNHICAFEIWIMIWIGCDYTVRLAFESPCIMYIGTLLSQYT